MPIAQVSNVMQSKKFKKIAIVPSLEAIDH